MFTILTLSPDSASNGLYTVLVSIHSVEVLKKTWEVVVDSMVGALGSFFFFFFLPRYVCSVGVLEFFPEGRSLNLQCQSWIRVLFIKKQNKTKIRGGGEARL